MTLSWSPILLAAGVTLLLLGVVVNLALVVVGVLLSALALGTWIRDIRARLLTDG